MTTPRVTVPVEPTEAMLAAMDRAIEDAPILDGDECGPYGQWRSCSIAAYSAMLSAAPAPEGGAVEDLREALIQADLKIRSLPGTDQSDVEFIRAALATREEAPAEAGEVTDRMVTEALKERFTPERYARDHEYLEANFREATRRQLAAALLAQPPAREDAQPFMFAYEDVDKPGDWRAFRHQIKRADGSICPGRPLYTHPAPDALRVAVEALEPFGQVMVDVGETEADDDAFRNARREYAKGPIITVGHVRRAAQALAALQAEGAN